jgi:hypothetical protein
MTSSKNYRDKGAKGALLDEYERAVNQLKTVIAAIQPRALTAIANVETTDPDCQSIQTVLTHVVRSGFGYAIYIRRHHQELIEFLESQPRDSVAAYQKDLDALLAFTEETFEKYPEIELETFDETQKIRVRWGQLYDVEQLMEHAIVHILRHRRQIERFILKLNAQSQSL